MLLLLKESQKLKPIVRNYLSGNRKDAATAIKKLNKLHLVKLLVYLHEIKVMNGPERLSFEDFVVAVLES